MAAKSTGQEVVAELRQIRQEWRALRDAQDELLMRRELAEARYPASRRLGDRVRTARVGLGLSQVMLARVAGLHPSTISRIERGANGDISGKAMLRLWLVFGPTVDLNVYSY
jgi:ribosome-binding protein aMBF1 (putative translation factor)